MTDHNPTRCETLEMQNRAVEVPNENGDLYQSPSFAHSYESRREAERQQQYVERKAQRQRTQLNLFPVVDEEDTFEERKRQDWNGVLLVVLSLIVLVAFSCMLATMTRYNREADQKAAERAMEPVSVPQLGVPQ